MKLLHKCIWFIYFLNFHVWWHHSFQTQWKFKINGKSCKVSNNLSNYFKLCGILKLSGKKAPIPYGCLSQLQNNLPGIGFKNISSMSIFVFRKLKSENEFCMKLLTHSSSNTHYIWPCSKLLFNQSISFDFELCSPSWIRFIQGVCQIFFHPVLYTRFLLQLMLFLVGVL